VCVCVCVCVFVSVCLSVCLCETLHQYLSRPDLHRAPAIMAMLEHAVLRSVFDAWFAPTGDVAWTTTFKWVRAVPPNLHTGVHIDRCVGCRCGAFN
jgi:hypothetical protein